MNRILVLDGWRGLSVLFVILGHLIHSSALASHFERAAGAHPAMQFLGIALGSFAGMGVHIFFCLSGYVICRGLWVEERRVGAICLSAFYVRRCFRIFPPLWVYLIALLIFQTVGLIQNEAGGAVRAALFVSNISITEGLGGGLLTAHTWSLSYEEQFYVFFPSVFAAFCGGRRVRVFFVAAVVLVLGGLFLNWMKLWGIAKFGYSFSPLVAGALFWLVQEQLPAWLIAFCKRWHGAMFFICCLLWLVPSGKVATLLTVGVGTPLLTLTVLGSAIWSTWLTDVLSMEWIVRIGSVSYGLYLWQQPFTMNWPGAGWLAYLGGLLLLSLIVWASYRFIETPMMRIGKRLSDKLRARAAAEAMSAIPLP
jgi:peptidoglycan/LPS O-acetylase OafA/YrhL